jgi:hypothetical protein
MIVHRTREQGRRDRRERQSREIAPALDVVLPVDARP